MGRNRLGDVYDGAWRTLVNDCTQLVLPLINEMFKESYDGTEKIEFHPNEHFIAQQDEPNAKVITDTNFTVIGRNAKKYHLECESSKYSEKILIRLFEYDAQIALDEGEVKADTIKVTFPHTAVVYLRNTSKTPERMHVVIEVPKEKVEYFIPVLKIAEYSIEEIFEKKLYILIPFYIFNYEKGFTEYNSNEKKLNILISEYHQIIDRLNDLVENQQLSSYDRRTIIELADDVMQELTKKYSVLQKEVGDMMGGEMIITEVHKARDEGRREGISQGTMQVAEKMIKANKPAKEITMFTDISIDNLKEMAANLGVTLML